jgi:hypothetical protein
LKLYGCPSKIAFVNFQIIIIDFRDRSSVFNKDGCVILKISRDRTCFLIVDQISPKDASFCLTLIDNIEMTISE